ncbi:energy-coupling factor transporter transmembrane component T family protein [Christensenella tenuis]|jgi:energy-coupling factor transport system permease protein|uniref:Energy-coupling factor transporter transmembrane protein EcfT n=1 Tax=Christensenella tenuis TaxID=2763033 RepID=A0ABR7EHV4_9FIRM|nr:energy-coupling factor transporter transmembrane component T [Christensenella tenuis]MBC5648609.1 energy-coupling factor transporter transmembrane protein EcfT [Christensenella tenuis]
MLKNITLGQYFPGDTVVHRLDPRIKILVALLFLVAVFVVRTMWGFLALALLFTLIIALAKIGPVTILRSIRPLLFIIIFTFVLNILFYSGQTIYWQWGFLTISKEGIEKAVFIAIRLVLLIVATSLLTLTTSPMQLTDGMESLLSPLKKIKFPVHEMAMMMSIAMRFIPTLVEETDRIMKAQTARGAEFDSGNLLKKAKNMIPLLVPLFVGAFKRADELALAMESRCYHGDEGRTRMKVLHLKRMDVWALILMLAVSILFMVFL